MANVSGLGAAPATAQTAASAAVKPGGINMGEDGFLRLFMESLKNQDPMSPMDNGQMMQQMALLGQMEQVTKMEQTVQQLKDATAGNQVIQAASLLGKTVVATGADGKQIVGEPVAYRINAGLIEYLINDKVVKIGQIDQVGITPATPPKTSASAAAPAAPQTAAGQ